MEATIRVYNATMDILRQGSTARGRRGSDSKIALDTSTCTTEARGKNRRHYRRQARSRGYVSQSLGKVEVEVKLVTPRGS